MGRVIGQPTAFSDALYQFNIFDHFDHYVTGDEWTSGGLNGESVAVAAGKNGILTMTTDTADNDDAWLRSTEVFLFESGIIMECVCRLDFTEVATSGQIIGFGLQSAVDDAAMQNGSGGPAASKDFAMIYKVDGELVWRCGAELAANTNPANLSTMASGRTHSKTTDFQTLKIRCEPNVAEMKVTYYVDPYGLGGFIPLSDSNGDVIEDTFTITGATEMALMVTVHAGSAAAHTLLVDYIGGWKSLAAAAGGVGVGGR